MDLSEFKKRPDPHSFKRHPWEISRGKIIINLINKATNLPVNHIADIGSGDGYITNLLSNQELASQYSAFDTALDEKILDSLAQTTHEKIRYFTGLDKADQKLPKADIILLLDVLEHVPSENTLINEIKQYVTTGPDTKWIITVPAFQSIFSRHDVILGHYRRYNLRQLTRLCNNNNLVIEQKGYFFLTLLIARLLVKKSPKPENPTAPPAGDTIQNWQGSPFLTRLVAGTLYMDYKIGTIINQLGLHIPGLSCYCICHQSH
jgi:methyltransferase family protein